MTILYWNLHKNDLQQTLKDCLLEYQIDIAFFSEFEKTPLDFEDIDYKTIDSPGGTKRIIAVCKKSIELVLVYEQARYAIYTLYYKDSTINISGIHLQDMFYGSKERRKNTIRSLIQDIDEIRGEKENRIIIGDFNADPFSEELLQYNCFNSVLFQDVILEREVRVVEKKEYQRLYNPILNFISEETKMYGSYYHSGDDATTVWHCIDQILVSADLATKIKALDYLKNIGGNSLLRNFIPNEKYYSDHLPLLVKISI